MRRRALFVMLAVGLVAVLGVAGVASAAPASMQAAVPGNTVLLAAGGSFPDSLSGGILSYAYDAPLLLTQKDTLPAAVATEIKRRGTPTVIILGGEGAVGVGVVSALRSIGITDIERIAGSNRYATSAMIANRAAAAVAAKNAGLLEKIGAVVDVALVDVYAQIDALVVRTDSVESQVTALDGRIDSLATSSVVGIDQAANGVSIVNSPDVNASQRGDWSVSILNSPTVRLDSEGATVTVTNTPTAPLYVTHSANRTPTTFSMGGGPAVAGTNHWLYQVPAGANWLVITTLSWPNRGNSYPVLLVSSADSEAEFGAPPFGTSTSPSFGGTHACEIYVAPGSTLTFTMYNLNVNEYYSLGVSGYYTDAP